MNRSLLRPSARPAPGRGLGRDAREWLLVGGATLLVFVAFYLAAGRGGVPSEYLANAALTMALFALFALGLQLQFGYAGLVNFGHIGAAAVGAYAVGVGHLHGLGLEATVPLGVAAAVVFALALGVPTLRLREDYLAIVTIGAAEIVRTLANGEAWLTRGAIGIYTFPRPGLAWATDPAGPWAAFAGGLGVSPYTLFVLALAVLLAGLTYAAFALLLSSPWGRVLKAIREDEGVAEALGKDTFRFKLQALAIGAVPAALYGMLAAWAFAQIVPDNFPPQVTFYALIIVVLGGVGNLRGALVGAVALVALLFLPQLVDLGGVPLLGGALEVLTRPGPGQLFLIGLLLIALMMFRPSGLVGRREEMLFGK